MKWELTDPTSGCMVRAKVGPLYHYGIYVSDEEVIQFGPNPTLRLNIPDSQLSVCATDIDRFLCGSFLEVAVPDRAERKKQHSPEKVVELARQRLGEMGYHILHNNCEHFANECLTGQKYSSQTDGLRAMFQKMNIVDVYVAAIAEGDMEPVLPELRQQQLEKTTHAGLRRQRYYVWKLLEYGLNRSLGLKMKNLHFSRDERGKWSCQECYFSLSHSQDAVAVAVSKKPVGVDIECLTHPVSPKLGDKILTDSERQQAQELPPEALPRFLLEKWSAKESLFKAGTDPVFRPQKLETQSGVHTDVLQIGEKSYCFAVASEDVQKLRLYQNIKL